VTVASKVFHIGTPGKPWGDEERAAWLAERSIKRSYQDEVLAKLEPLKQVFDVEQYGSLSYIPDKYPLFAAKTRGWDKSKPFVLVTGGVHGYETSGVQGALLFLQTKAQHYSQWFNILVAPCVSPWGYEQIQRWNAKAVDPNRSFNGEPFAEESAALKSLLASLGVAQWTAHVDLHETTNSDESEFRPAKAARDGEEFVPDYIPDGFYLVGNSESPQAAWQKAIIDEVRKVTHIAPPDEKGLIIGTPIAQEGVINYPVKSLGLCASVTGATYVTTTEVYPDSPKADDEQCNRAQVAAVTGALDYILKEDLKITQ